MPDATKEPQTAFDFEQYGIGQRHGHCGCELRGPGCRAQYGFGLRGRITRAYAQARGKRQRGRGRHAGSDAARRGFFVAGKDESARIDDGKRLRRRRAAQENLQRQVRQVERYPEHGETVSVSVGRSVKCRCHRGGCDGRRDQARESSRDA